LDKEVGDLGVRRLREFNLALLGKWCWRMAIERDGLWFRILTARYGGFGGWLQQCGSEGSVWWKDIISIRDGGGMVMSSWFFDNLRLKVGNDASTMFWLDRWVSEAPLCEKFPRLYELSENKLSIVAQMFEWGWDDGGEAWKWRQRLWVWEEEMVEECRNLLLTVMLQADTTDV